MNEPTHDDEALFLKFQQGDEAALDLLFRRYAPRFRALVERRLPGRLRRRLSVADVVQEAQLATVQNRDHFENRGPDSFRRWVFGILDNKVREAVRRHEGTDKRAFDREISQDHRPATAQFLANRTSPSQAAIASESSDRIAEALSSLPEDYRQVLRLTRQEGLSLAEAAERMGRSREATKKLYGRALVRLKLAMDQQEDKDGG